MYPGITTPAIDKSRGSQIILNPGCAINNPDPVLAFPGALKEKRHVRQT